MVWYFRILGPVLAGLAAGFLLTERYCAAVLKIFSAMLGLGVLIFVLVIFGHIMRTGIPICI